MMPIHSAFKLRNGKFSNNEFANVLTESAVKALQNRFQPLKTQSKRLALLLLIGFAQCTFASPQNRNAQAPDLEALWESVVTQDRKILQTNNANPRKVVVSEDEQLLNRQRAAWRAKWEAEQKKKQQQQVVRARNKTENNTSDPVEAGQNAVVSSQAGTQLKSADTKPKNAAPKSLTRAEYHARYQKLQREKQAAARKSTIKPSPSHSARKNAVFGSLPQPVRNKLKAARLSEVAMSTFVQGVHSSKPLLAYQDHISRVPASVMKLITAYAALGILGPDYRWPIEIYTRGPIRNGTLSGDLMIKGYGSPEFNTADLRKLLHGIKQKGIRHISGRVVFDNSLFNIPVKDSGSFDGQKYKAYNALPDALLFNERITEFQIRPGKKKVQVTTPTPAHNLKIVNKIRKVRRGCKPRISITKRGSQTIVTFGGRYSSRCGTRTYTRVLNKPTEMIYGVMKSLWKREVGGNFKAVYAEGTVPRNAKLLTRQHSKTLSEILPAIVKDSNNVMARQVLLTMGAKHAEGQGTPRKGAIAIDAWLKKRRLNFPELRIENGSGLSRHARISARHVGDLLVDAYKSPHRNIMMRSLAIAGIDGTMKGRLKKSPVRGRGFFKTGTLKDVRSIAGYVKAADGKTYVVAILHNDPKARRRARAAHDELIEWIYTTGRNRERQLASR